MLKFLSGVFVGVFAGALAYEVIKRKKPELYMKINHTASIVADGIVSITRPNKSAKNNGHGDKERIEVVG